jgi:2,4-dienoyl-CoA reductase-like NADH-dependent reductase (Old Yellow Enzyme family)
MSALFSPLDIRSVRFPNRIMISPMCQYSALDGAASQWHTVHVGKLAAGGAGSVMLEATAVEKRGRITYGDLGLWDDALVPGLRALASQIEAHGSVPAIQIGHAGRKASSQRPWHGNAALGETDERQRLEMRWPTVAASALAMGPGWHVPRELPAEELPIIAQAFEDAARRAVSAGFRLVELHMAHGYLLHTFLSPLSNCRTDAFGGSLQARMRFPLEVAERVRHALGPDVAMSARLSTVDGIDGGWSIEDSVTFSQQLAARGVDLIDCSSGGIGGSATVAGNASSVRRYPGFQVPFAHEIRQRAAVSTIAVGLITDPHQAEAVVSEGRADLVAIGREALYNPNWPLHASRALGVDPNFERWSPQYGWWLARRTGLDTNSPR